MSSPLGMGLVGLGGISRAHLAGYERLGSLVNVAAVFDQDSSRAAHVASSLGARPHTSLTGLLEDPAVEAVDLMLPHHAHFAAASEALSAGRHVLVEKPLALSSDECRLLIEQAREAGLRWESPRTLASSPRTSPSSNCFAPATSASRGSRGR